MAFVPGVNATNYPTLVDVAKRLDPDGSIATVAELLAETNEILQDAVYLEGNLPTGHRTTIRADLPSATWRKLNYGVKPTKSHTVQVTDSVGMLETYAEVDKELANLNGNTSEFRLSEDRPHLEGMNIQLSDTMFYGDTATNPERFLGLAPRYNSLSLVSGKPAANSYGEPVLNHGGTGSDVTSIWLVVWGPNTVHMIYPKGSKAGLEHRDLGEVTLFDDDGGRFQGYRTHYQMKAGMTVRDWRYIIRIANIETGDLSTPDTLDYKFLVHAINRIPNLGMGRPVFYCNRAVKALLDLAAAEKSNACLSIDTVFGRPQTSFWGIPVKQCDSILLTETAVS